MNERIQQLEKQCWETKQLTNDAHSWHTSFNTQKFSELIVRECLEQVRFEVQYEYDLGLADSVSERVLEHFGVEE